MPAITYTPVKGLPELNAALARAGRFLDRELQTRLKYYAEPVRASSELLAVVQIPTITFPWAQARVGANRNMVYVAPVKRGTRIASRRRPNLARKLLVEAMIPALNQNRAAVEEQIDALVARMEREYERGRP